MVCRFVSVIVELFLHDIFVINEDSYFYFNRFFGGQFLPIEDPSKFIKH